MFGPGRSLPPQRRRVGYVPQEGALFPHLDVAGNITFGMPRGARRKGTRVAELLELVGLPFAVSTRLPHELSGGQQQRVALARALAPSPSVVLLDEPFASLDAGLREGTGRAVADALRHASATGILVTHDQGEALSLADQVAVMRDGRLAQVGTPKQVYDAPADLDVARFVGGAVVLPAVVEGGHATSVLGTLDVPVGATQGAVEVLVRPEQIVLTPAGHGRTRGRRARRRTAGPRRRRPDGHGARGQLLRPRLCRAPAARRHRRAGDLTDGRRGRAGRGRGGRPAASAGRSASTHPWPADHPGLARIRAWATHAFPTVPRPGWWRCAPTSTGWTAAASGRWWSPSRAR